MGENRRVSLRTVSTEEGLSAFALEGTVDAIRGKLDIKLDLLHLEHDSGAGQIEELIDVPDAATLSRCTTQKA